MDREAHRAQFERMGIDMVRAQLISGKLPLQMTPDAIAWTAQLDREERERNSASLAAQALDASRQRVAAERQSAAAERQAAAAEEANSFARTANTRATMALIIATVCAIISIVTAAVVHWDATHPIAGTH